MTEQKRPVNVIRLRAIFTGILLAVGICLLTPFNNIYHQATPLGGGHFPLAPFFIFILSLQFMPKYYVQKTCFSQEQNCL